MSHQDRQIKWHAEEIAEETAGEIAVEIAQIRRQMINFEMEDDFLDDDCFLFFIFCCLVRNSDYCYFTALPSSLIWLSLYIIRSHPAKIKSNFRYFSSCRAFASRVI